MALASCDASFFSGASILASGTPSLSGSTSTTALTATAGPTAAVPVVGQPQLQLQAQSVQVTTVGQGALGKPGVLTAKDIERDSGKPLTKYERNMMIFTWLQTLQEAAPVTSASLASVAGLDVQQS